MYLSVKELSSFDGTQSMGAFPLYFPVRTTEIKVSHVIPDDVPAP